MEIIDLAEYKNKLNEYNNVINELKDALKIEEKTNELKILEEKTTEEGFWNDEKESSKVLVKIKEIKSVTEELTKRKRI